MQAILILSALTIFHVDPWSNKPFLPHEDPAGGVETESISFAAARGEFEAISFIVRPDRDIEKVDVIVSELTGPDGARIPSDAADVTTVKVWFRPGGRWNSSWRADQENPEPINNLVLHDDALVKVDWNKKINYLRGVSSDGAYYMDVSHRDSTTVFNHDCEPVSDASRFIPFDLRKDFRQQYLVTWKIPKSAKPGNYTGNIELVSRKNQGLPKNIASIAVGLEVYPFSLPRPRTHYDTRKSYVSYWMGSPTLASLIVGGHRLDRAERKLRAIFRNMAEHNAVNLSGVGDLACDSTDDYALRTLLIARQEGMCADGLINGKSFDQNGKFVFAPGPAGKKSLLVPEAHPELYAKSLASFREAVMRQNSILDKYLGHHRCYYSSVDECSYRTNRRAYGYWNIVHELGANTWTDSGSAFHNGAFIDMNDVAGQVSHGDSWSWHASDAKAVTYASTFTGPENPDLWRRIKGMRFWYADFDGQHEYHFFDGHCNRWNDFVRYDRYCQFGIVYWTLDGLVSTLAWEAVREALDDVRYYTLLRLRAEAALASQDPAVRRLGRDALVWQDGVDPELILDLNEFRRETSEWIKRLVAKVGPQPEDVDTELPPPELPDDTRWKTVPKASDGAAAVFAYAEKMAGSGVGTAVGEGRFDLALTALDDLLADGSVASADRVRAALRAADLFSGMRQRRDAVSRLDRALAIPDISNADRGKLLLKSVGVRMTDERFEEKYTQEQLACAEEVLLKALKLPGVGEEERAAAIVRLASGYYSAGTFEHCIRFIRARLSDTKLSGCRQADLNIIIGESFNALGQWDGALKAFKEAHRANNNEKSGPFLRRISFAEARAAEMAKDYDRAGACWAALIPVFDSVEEAGKINEAKAHAARLSKLARKTRPLSEGSIDDDGSEAISLDE